MESRGEKPPLGLLHHSSAALLDHILTEHPEVEFAQTALNYIDWESKFVQAKTCYEVLRKHGKQVAIMAPVKGGGLAKVPASVETTLKEMAPGASMASWAMRFAGSLEGILATLSSMSTLEQVRDNIRTVKTLAPFSGGEKQKLLEIAKPYRDADPTGVDLSRCAGLTLHGVPVTGILDAYNICQLQPNPGSSDDNNYLKNIMAERAHLDCFGELPEGRIIPSDGTDAAEEVLKVERWLIRHSF